MKKLLSAAAIIAALASAVPASAQRTGPGPSANTGTGGVIPPGGYGPSSSLRNLNGGSAGLPGAAPLGRSKSWRRRSRVGLSRLSCCGNSPEDQEPLIREGGAGSPGVHPKHCRRAPSPCGRHGPRDGQRPQQDCVANGVNISMFWLQSGYFRPLRTSLRGQHGGRLYTANAVLLAGTGARSSTWSGRICLGNKREWAPVRVSMMDNQPNEVMVRSTRPPVTRPMRSSRCVPLGATDEEFGALIAKWRQERPSWRLQE